MLNRGGTVAGHLAPSEGTRVGMERERADGAWKRDAPPGEYQTGQEETTPAFASQIRDT